MMRNWDDGGPIPAALTDYDTAMVFNAVRKLLGGGPEGEGLERIGGVPVNYVDQTIRARFPELGVAVGRATTCEVTTNEQGVDALSWDDYYDYLDRTPGPTVTIIKDVDSRPGRGSSLGDIMVLQHKMLGSTGIVVDGTIRDSVGLRRAGLPVWATGHVSGHGLFHVVRYDAPVVVGGLRITPGDLLVADEDGVIAVPDSIDLDELVRELAAIRDKEALLAAQYEIPGMTLAGIREYFKTYF
jgi:regulator of RNase E activity RraA